MATMKNSQILPYFHFNKIIKGPGTIFQSQALAQKHVKNVYYTVHYLSRFYFDGTYDSKEISLSITSIIWQCLWIRGFHKNKNLDISRMKDFFFKLKDSLVAHFKCYFMAKINFAVQVTFKGYYLVKKWK